jgi:hypothetical protein
MNVPIKESVFDFRRSTIETSGIPIVKIRDTLYPLVQAEQSEFDHKIVRQTVLGFRFILQCRVCSGPLYQSPYCVVFKFLLARSLGIRALGESEDVARVNALLSTLSLFSALSSRMRRAIFRHTNLFRSSPVGVLPSILKNLPTTNSG